MSPRTSSIPHLIHPSHIITIQALTIPPRHTPATPHPTPATPHHTPPRHPHSHQGVHGFGPYATPTPADGGRRPYSPRPSHARALRSVVPSSHQASHAPLPAPYGSSPRYVATSQADGRARACRRARSCRSDAQRGSSTRGSRGVRCTCRTEAGVAAAAVAASDAAERASAHEVRWCLDAHMSWCSSS
jgi:hypothetical protein